MAIGQELLNVPMGEMIRSMAFAIADAQFALDKSSINVAAMMSGHQLVLAADGIPVTLGDNDAVPEGFTKIGDKLYGDTRVWFGSTDTTVAPHGAQVTLTLTHSGSDTHSVAAATALTLAGDSVGGWKTDTAVTVPAKASGVDGTATVTATRNEKAEYNVTTGTVATFTSTLGQVTATVLNQKLPGSIGVTTRKPNLVSMLELGFSPTFYQFVDTIIEVKIAIKITSESEYGYKQSTKTDTTTNTNRGAIGWSPFGGVRVSQNTKTVQTSQVDASYTAKYGYSAEGSSFLRTKLVPIPPPAILEERIRAMLEDNKTNPDIKGNEAAKT